jgi:hypothetical protein
MENPRKPTPQELRVMQVKRSVRTEEFRRKMLKKAAANIGQARQRAETEGSSLTAGHS